MHGPADVFQQVIEGLQIIGAQPSQRRLAAADTNRIYAGGWTKGDLGPEIIARLEELHWHWSSEYTAFYHQV